MKGKAPGEWLTGEVESAIAEFRSFLNECAGAGECGRLAFREVTRDLAPMFERLPGPARALFSERLLREMEAFAGKVPSPAAREFEGSMNVAWAAEVERRLFGEEKSHGQG